MDLHRQYYSQKVWTYFKSEFDKHTTPFNVVDLGIIRENYHKLRGWFPTAHIHYAVKANSSREILKLLRDLGSSFDVASIYELEQLLHLEVEPHRISFGNTIKKGRDIEYAYQQGVRLFVSDSEEDVRNLAIYAPGVRMFVRVTTEGGDTADWPLSRKFGCHPDLTIALLMLAKELGLDPCGISFHVGSQQRDVGSWDTAIRQARSIFSTMVEQGLPLRLLNMGGGLPANYLSRVLPLDVYAQEINRCLTNDFGADAVPEIMLEPGRGLVGNAGVLATEVVLISKKSHAAVDRWVYLDAGTYNGLSECLGEAIKYPLYCESPGELSTEFIMAGPTCDSQDILYEKFRNPLPAGLKSGDRIYFLTTGAYASSCCSAGFNGFPPLKTYYVDSAQ
jgi:ornithine decarboxylase